MGNGMQNTTRIKFLKNWKKNMTPGKKKHMDTKVKDVPYFIYLAGFKKLKLISLKSTLIIIIVQAIILSLFTTSNP